MEWRTENEVVLWNGRLRMRLCCGMESKWKSCSNSITASPVLVLRNDRIIDRQVVYYVDCLLQTTVELTHPK